MIPGGVVAHPIQNHLHALCVGGVYHIFKILEVPKLWVHTVIVFDAIITAQSAFAVELSDGINGHKPKHIHAQIFESGNFWGEGIEGSAGIKLSGIHLINHAVFHPVYGNGGAFDCGRGLYLNDIARWHIPHGHHRGYFGIVIDRFLLKQSAGCGNHGYA